METNKDLDGDIATIPAEKKESSVLPMIESLLGTSPMSESVKHYSNYTLEERKAWKKKVKKAKDARKMAAKSRKINRKK